MILRRRSRLNDSPAYSSLPKISQVETEKYEESSDESEAMRNSELNYSLASLDTADHLRLHQSPCDMRKEIFFRLINDTATPRRDQMLRVLWSRCFGCHGPRLGRALRASWGRSLRARHGRRDVGRPMLFLTLILTFG